MIRRRISPVSIGRASILLAVLILPASLGLAQTPGRCGGIDERLCAAPDMSLQPPGARPQRLKYGSRHWQDIAFYPARSEARPPLAVILSDGGRDGDGGWLRYRLNQAVISAAFVDTDQDVRTMAALMDSYAEALRYLVAESAALGFDQRRLAIFGTYDAALLGTDPSFIANTPVPFASIKALVIGGSTEFDLPARVAARPEFAGRYRRFFGGDAADYRRYSAMAHVVRPNAPAFLFVIAEDASDGIDETQAMAAALSAAGTDARFLALPAFRPNARATHYLLEPDGSGKEIIPFLQEQFAR